MKLFLCILIVLHISSIKPCVTEITDSDSLYTIAKVHYDKGNYKKTVTEFLNILRIDKAWIAHTYYNLGLHDNTTCALMIEFSTSWLNGKSKYNDLGMSNRYVKEQTKWSESNFWAASILLDALN